MSNPKAYLLAIDGKSFPDHKWDFGLLKESFEKNKVDYEQVTALPKCNKAFVVICGDENKRMPSQINEELAKIKRVVLFITADEGGLFRADKIKHPNISIWIQSPYPDRHAQFNKFPIGAPFSLKENHPEYTGKKYDVFFSGQVTHQRRQELNDAMANIKNALNNPTPGFTQGYEQKEYLQHFLESRLGPAPAGTATIDSFRFYEALEMLCLPIGDTKSSTGQEYDFWDFVFSQEVPVPKTSDWKELGTIVDKALLDYPANMHRAVSWWIRYKRDFAYKIMEELNG